MIFMKEESFIRLVLILSFIGLILLYILMQYIEPPEMHPVLAEKDQIIKLNGMIIDIQNAESITYITLIPETPLTVVSFDEVDDSFLYQKVTIEGTVDTYNNKKQLLLDKIKDND